MSIPSTQPRTVRDRALLSSRRYSLLIAMFALALSLAVSGCEAISHVKSEHYKTRSEAPTHGDLAFVLPDLIPADATDITVRVNTEAPDDKMYHWKSVSGALATGCRPEPATAAQPFDPKAWPKAVLKADGKLCSGYHVRAVDGQYYGW